MISKVPRNKNSGSKKRLKIKKLILYIYNKSNLLKFLRRNILNFTARKGFLLPFGDTYYLSEKVYEYKKADIEKIFKSLNAVAINKEVEILIYLLPEFNVLNHSKYFKKFVAAYKDNGFDKLKIIDELINLKINKMIILLINMMDIQIGKLIKQ